MALSIYKPGQGYYTRMLSAVGFGTIVLSGVMWAWAQMEIIAKYTIYWQAGMAIATIAVFGALIFYLLNHPKIADFMIATEAEMKKVNWPSRPELIGSTIVVIGGTFLIAIVLFVVDFIFGYFFTAIHVLGG